MLGLTLLLANARQNLHISNKLQAILDRPYFIERIIYRHHRKAGAMLIAASMLWLWLLSPLSVWHQFLTLTWEYLTRMLASDHLLTILVSSIFSLTTLVVGLLLIIRPSLLRPLETRANRWITQPATSESTPKQPLIMYTRKITGMILLLTGIASLWSAIKLNTLF